MPDPFDIISRWWKYILLLVLISVSTAAVIVFLKPSKWLATATALPAATYATDKAGIFSENLQVLYPDLGTPDDLDKIVGTSFLDTVYFFVTDKLTLASYYDVNDENKILARQRAAAILKQNTKVIKSDYGELKVKVWDKDRNKAADLANAVLEKLQSINQEVMNTNNRLVLEQIKKEYGIKQKEFINVSDTIQRLPESNQKTILMIKRDALLHQLSQFEKLSGEYELMVKANPQALITIERARSSLYPDKPKRLQVIIATAILSFIFAILTILILERRKTHTGE